MDYLKKLSQSIVTKLSQSSFSSLEKIIFEIRCNLQFTQTPTRHSMENGFVDCVGAAVVCQKVLSMIYSNEIFRVALVQKVPWNTGKYSENRHCIVVRFSDYEKYIQLIDPTPINGYGYGKISKLFEAKLWKIKNEKSYIISTSIKDWNDYLYPRFIIIDSNEISRILATSQMKADLYSDNILVVKQPPKNFGWRKEYYRVLSKKSLLNGDKIKAISLIKKALKCFPNDPYILREYIDVLNHQINIDRKKINRLICLEKKSTKMIIKYNNQACKKWRKELSASFSSKDWMSYFYYLGCIYWREQSNNFLSLETLRKIPSVFFEGNELPLYKLLPRWFESNNVKIVVSAVKPKDAIFSFSYIINEVKSAALVLYELQCFYESGWVSLFPKKKDSSCGHSYYGREAHNCLFALIAPELLIV
jgi:hypothetical protein